ncbi:hypothetical protein OCA8868_03181 [Octadecabacter ascidiaceicola]|uniref:Uncharacterized protein n=1 Tax=Octadecabacter ascidiaceicola TaxID=1655543 RepID=A0A238KPM4_9RHOB|nr:hypothetical protein OCA8868_03181 [Octadecabacter ascidiaceicola]
MRISSFWPRSTLQFQTSFTGTRIAFNPVNIGKVVKFSHDLDVFASLRPLNFDCSQLSSMDICRDSPHLN